MGLSKVTRGYTYNITTYSYGEKESMNQGWIKLHKQMKEWEWYKKPNTLALWIHLLLSANWEDKQWRGITIKRGQLVTSNRKLSLETGIPLQPTKTSLTNLQNAHQITRTSTSKYTIISINKYEDYQELATQKTTSEQPTKRKPATHKLTTTKEIKNINNINIIRRNANVDLVLQKFIETFGHNPIDKKPRQTAWNLIQRLSGFVREMEGNQPNEERIKQAVIKYFHWVDAQKSLENSKNLDVIKRNLEIYFAIVRGSNAKTH